MKVIYGKLVVKKCENFLFSCFLFGLWVLLYEIEVFFCDFFELELLDEDEEVMNIWNNNLFIKKMFYYV